MEPGVVPGPEAKIVNKLWLLGLKMPEKIDRRPQPRPGEFKVLRGIPSHQPSLRRVESGNAGAGPPAVRLDAGPVEQIAEPPAQEAAPRQRGAAPGIENRPPHKPAPAA